MTYAITNPGGQVSEHETVGECVEAFIASRPDLQGEEIRRHVVEALSLEGVVMVDVWEPMSDDGEAKT